jgi:hypothetical protein
MAPAVTVSARLEAKVRSDFAPASVEKVLDRLAALSLPLAENQSLERIQAAIVLLTAGDSERLEQVALLAEVDWRDVLVAAGLANGDWPARLDEKLGS